MKNDYTHVNLNSFYGIVKALSECKTVDRLTKVGDVWIRGRGRTEHNGYYDMAGDENGMIFYPDYLCLAAKQMILPLEEQVRVDLPTQLPIEAGIILRCMRRLIDEQVRNSDTINAEDQEKALYNFISGSRFSGDWLTLYNELTKLDENDLLDFDEMAELYVENNELHGIWFEQVNEELLVPLTPMKYMDENTLENEIHYGQYTWSTHLPGTRSMFCWRVSRFNKNTYFSMPLWFTANRA